MASVLESLRGGLIVSCQAAAGSPLDSPAVLAALAQAAESAGAVGIRANLARNIAAIKAVVQVPIVGIRKRDVPGYSVYITPEFCDAQEAREAGAAIVALDATARPRPGPADFRALASRIHRELGALVMADISTFDEGAAAEQVGADLLATTLSGYTPYTVRDAAVPDLALVERLAGRVRCPVLCEGMVHTPDQARAALDAGAFAVVVGTAITSPGWITSQFIARMDASR